MRNRLLKVGITGGIGSGKTIVCRIFEMLGIPVYYADIKAKNLIENNPEIKANIINTFGQSSFTPEGYNRKYMASLVFNNFDLLEKLNAIVHPSVTNDFKEWCQEHSSAQYVVHESAVLFESGVHEITDYIIVIDAPLEQRIKRIKERDSITDQEIMKRINNQWPSEKLSSLANWVIHNDNNNLVIPQVIKIHEQIARIANSNG
jgi:dephospho-CoA kinase